MFYQIFLSPQVERCAIITYQHGIYKLPHQLSCDLRLRILGNQEISEKRLISIEGNSRAQFTHQHENLLTPAKKSSKKYLKFLPSAPFHMKTRVSLRCFVNNRLWKPLFDSNSNHTPSNLISLTTLLTLRRFKLF